MSAEIFFLNPTSSSTNYVQNYAHAIGSATYYNYSHASESSLSSAESETLVNGGVSLAIAEARTTFINDPTFTDLFTDSYNVALDGTYELSSQSKTKIVADFTVGANENFSFEFSASLALDVKEIENRNTEFNFANSKIGFLVLDTSDINRPKIIDFFGAKGNLISSEKIGNVRFLPSNRVSITGSDRSYDIDGNNGQDFANGLANGSYQRTFNHDSKITIVEINDSTTAIKGDTLIGNLGQDVTYGTIWNDTLVGDSNANKIYASLGDDVVFGNGGNDTIEGGRGNDLLNGGDGIDKISGGLGNDILIGGRGNDVLVGGDGADTFVFQQLDSFLSTDNNVIKDFQVNVDKVKFLGLILTNQLVDTQNGALLTLNNTKVLFEGVFVDQLNASNFEFA
ncbi:calcium-binding protein [Calothrix sp. NIES-2098]|uniref:calcium-binding protein n=1 Tax=Calothrix sp. NIES-2098 TaxID=1954171 RepID=UPI000B5FE8CB|nr:hemolysin-type calcium-binding region protein [Calothrix sp. NIES-2098]